MADSTSTVTCKFCRRGGFKRTARHAPRLGGSGVPPHKCPHGKPCSELERMRGRQPCSVCEAITQGIAEVTVPPCVFCQPPEGIEAQQAAIRAKGGRGFTCYTPEWVKNPGCEACRRRSYASRGTQPTDEALVAEVKAGVVDVFAGLR